MIFDGFVSLFQGSSECSDCGPGFFSGPSSLLAAKSATQRTEVVINAPWRGIATPNRRRDTWIPFHLGGSFSGLLIFNKILQGWRRGNGTARHFAHSARQGLAISTATVVEAGYVVNSLRTGCVPCARGFFSDVPGVEARPFSLRLGHHARRVKSAASGGMASRTLKRLKRRREVIAGGGRFHRGRL